MSVPPVRGLPPKLLRFDTMISEGAPTLACIRVEADNGTHMFLVKRDVLEFISKVCLETAAKLPKASALT
jgi:hypothetical protein